jgi:hypothetical protein
MVYANSFYKRGEQGSREMYEGENPTEYKGFQIFEWSSIEFHIVKDGVCVGMMAGINGAKKRIDRGDFPFGKVPESMAKIPTVGTPFKVSFKDGSREFSAMIIYQDDDPRETDREFRVMHWNNINRYQVSDRKFEDKNADIKISCVEKNWFNTELTGRIITPLEQTDFHLVRLTDLLDKPVKGITAEITNPMYVHHGDDLKWRTLDKVSTHKERGKEWIQAYFQTQKNDSCGFTGCTVERNSCQFIISDQTKKEIGL